ncbi:MULTISPECIES: hypothetical protein [unclassified Sphingomonas]|jgi:phage shock protein A|uniref:hypothetical protein n=1 Tax=unclassified Sphingomonas TaxID=196159 RepID=UPI0006FECB66|nr:MULTISPECIES: hypothetical protein [unclassified Sphingomonas]KQM27059.1 hypothetical protein ASE58_08710 [Sphingomonas sp. Leaf9]KQM43393.1 hypothetical protein ASE57_08705 [Sphingomonas sp. Leaf11]KQM88321.1 hypothetical protein ASE67_00715 [Sphingomonas sp. Leaf23]
MSDTPHAATIARIERALERIERAAQAQGETTRALSSRHAALRTRIGDAIGALDAVIAREADAD